MNFSRKWAMPSSDTFNIKPIGEFVQKYLSKSTVSVDPFARNKRWATYTNDLNPATQAEYHMDALAFLKMLEVQRVEADLIIFDPPYSTRQIVECYANIGKKGTMEDMQAPWTLWKRQMNKLCTNTSTVLSFGWNTIGMGKKYGFKIIEIMLVCHGGSHNDTICIAERKTQGELFT